MKKLMLAALAAMVWSGAAWAEKTRDCLFAESFTHGIAFGANFAAVTIEQYAGVVFGSSEISGLTFDQRDAMQAGARSARCMFLRKVVPMLESTLSNPKQLKGCSPSADLLREIASLRHELDRAAGGQCETAGAGL